MATVVIHAGMPKNGSSSIQSWLSAQSVALREKHDTHVLADQLPADGPLRLRPIDGLPTMASTTFALQYAHAMTNAPEDRASIVASLTTAIDDAAADCARLVISGELLAGILSRREEPFLVGLQSLASRHDVRIAYYVSPQHRALEARWRAWGYKTSMDPGEWMLGQREDLSYYATAAAIAEYAPGVRFEVRPFVFELMHRGAPAADFARHFLGIDAGDEGAIHHHRGLTLDAVTLLRALPRQLIRTPGSDGPNQMESGVRQAAIAKHLTSWGIPDSSAAERSREVLHHHAFHEYEEDNCRLAAEHGWANTSLIAPPIGEPGHLDDLAALWTPSASATELAYLAHALTDLLESS